MHPNRWSVLIAFLTFHKEARKQGETGLCYNVTCYTTRGICFVFCTLSALAHASLIGRIFPIIPSDIVYFYLMVMSTSQTPEIMLPSGDRFIRRESPGQWRRHATLVTRGPGVIMWCDHWPGITRTHGADHRLRLLNVNCCQKMTIVDHRAKVRQGHHFTVGRGGPVTYCAQFEKQRRLKYKYETDILQRSRSRIESRLVWVTA